SDRRGDLADLPGPLLGQHLYRVLEHPHASYQAVLDAASGELGPDGPLLELVGSDGAQLIQGADPGAGTSRALHWLNPLGVPRADDYVRVASLGCAGGCDASAVYRLRFRDTTAFVPRFNNSGSQVTLLLLQNTGDEPLDADVRLWGMTGEELGGVVVL